MSKDGLYCVVMPVYNNAGTVGRVAESVLAEGYRLIAVSDGSDDGTLEVLESFGDRIELVSYPVNRGKGYALVCGFRRAAALGFRYAVTIDADGQHAVSDIDRMVSVSRANPDAVIIGSRRLDAENMPSANTFANRFSNFWFAVHTLHRIPDTQSGFRVYPLSFYGRYKAVTSRYEAELEMIVRGAWKGLGMVPCAVSVYYPDEKDRVTHFHPWKDGFRISVLNTVLTFAAIFYGYPSMLICRLIDRRK